MLIIDRKRRIVCFYFIFLLYARARVWILSQYLNSLLLSLQNIHHIFVCLFSQYANVFLRETEFSLALSFEWQVCDYNNVVQRDILVFYIFFFLTTTCDNRQRYRAHLSFDGMNESGDAHGTDISRYKNHHY